MPAYRPIPERIADWSMPEPNSGCWIWIGGRDKCGYGKMTCRRPDGGYESLAHRAAYQEFVGEIPAGMEIDHLCLNRACVNPDHLRAVSHAENIARADYTKNHRNGRKTHCKRGHVFDDANTYTDKLNGRPRRRCRECRRIMRAAKARALRRAAA